MSWFSRKNQTWVCHDNIRSEGKKSVWAQIIILMNLREKKNYDECDIDLTQIKFQGIWLIDPLKDGHLFVQIQVEVERQNKGLYQLNRDGFIRIQTVFKPFSFWLVRFRVKNLVQLRCGYTNIDTNPIVDLNC